MINYPKQENFFQGYIVHTKRLGIAFLIFGVLGILFPTLMGMTVSVFLGWLMLFLGLFAGYVTYKANPKSFWGWLKAVLLVIVGVWMIARPGIGASALTILMASYLLIDSSISFGLAFSRIPTANKIWSVINGLVSILLAIIFIFIAPNPVASSWFLGLYVGISLLFDGIVLISFSNQANKTLQID
jgi:uncharacterized membrane protein HdeD (DUF308 family)